MSLNLNNHKHPKKIKIRKDWGGVDPVTRIKDSDKRYRREKLTPQRIYELYGI